MRPLLSSWVVAEAAVVDCGPFGFVENYGFVSLLVCTVLLSPAWSVLIRSCLCLDPTCTKLDDGFCSSLL